MTRSWRYNSIYSIEVDVKKDDCRREPAHCHVCKFGRRVAQVWLISCTFSSSPSDIPYSEQSNILDFIRDISSEIKESYRYYAENGAD
ncbi:DUF4160 domain-containing protein [Candidatus Saccharibacteria bacterium]|nr:DUF4160 domain-containing protein [Candidatus Saccharibacteria bacterium]